MEQRSRASLSAERILEWQQTVEQELQELVTTAAQLRQTITSAKTATKKQYFEKKFKKVQHDVMSMLVTLQRLKEMTIEQQGAASVDEQSTVA